MKGQGGGFRGDGAAESGLSCVGSCRNMAVQVVKRSLNVKSSTLTCCRCFFIASLDFPQEVRREENTNRFLRSVSRLQSSRPSTFLLIIIVFVTQSRALTD